MVTYPHDARSVLNGRVEFAFGLPNGIAISPDNTVWVADSGNNRIERFSNIQP
ncbi:MAG: hypothetical protein IMZ61_14570 [Planctomycetes bacterium]|nr:hypothetical protein [Planctomycetota bacterium]